MPTTIVLRPRADAQRPVASSWPGPHLALILVLTLMVFAAGAAGLTPPDPQTWATDIASP